MFICPIVANSTLGRDHLAWESFGSFVVFLLKNIKKHVHLVLGGRDKLCQTWLELLLSGRETASRFSSLSGCLGV